MGARRPWAAQMDCSAKVCPSGSMGESLAGRKDIFSSFQVLIPPCFKMAMAASGLKRTAFAFEAHRARFFAGQMNVLVESLASGEAEKGAAALCRPTAILP